jgi:aspartyl protease family protein
VGTFKVRLEVGDPTGKTFDPVEALVDTGSTYTVIPASMLRRLGVSPHRRSTFELADGSHKEWEVGRTWVRLEQKSEMTLVVFGEEDVEPILGAVTMEEFLVAPDPIRRRLVPVPGLLMGARSS